MKVVIIEDEPLAAEKLERYLLKSSMDIEVLAKLPSLSKSISWLLDHQNDVDLLFMDIQLQDGLCFEIFSRMEVLKPVIFTTAFDEYAIDAFKVNSVDYLLKPISFTALSKALSKFDRLKQQFISAGQLEPIIQKIKENGYKSRFLVKMGNHIKSILTKNVAYFYSEDKHVFLITSDGKRYVIEYKLEELEGFLQDESFFRINRSLIANIIAIKDVVVYSNRRLKLTLNPPMSKEAVVARERVADFKKWFEGN